MKSEIEDTVKLYLLAQSEPSGSVSFKAKTAGYDQIVKNFCEILPLDHLSQEKLEKQLANLGQAEKVSRFLTELLESAYGKREKQLTPAVMRELERVVYLRTLDRLWVDHLDAMDDLRDGIRLRGDEKTALAIYKKEAFEMFENLMDSIEGEVIRRVFRVQLGPVNLPVSRANLKTNVDRQDKIGLVSPPSRSGGPLVPAADGTGSASPKVRPVVSNRNKIGRNDPCPCGAVNPRTKKPYKYKKCGLINAPHHLGG